MLHQVMEAEVSAQVGATLHERSEDRTAWRNGYRLRSLARSGLGAVQLVLSDAHAGLKKAIAKALVGAT